MNLKRASYAITALALVLSVLNAEARLGDRMKKLKQQADDEYAASINGGYGSGAAAQVPQSAAQPVVCPSGPRRDEAYGREVAVYVTSIHDLKSASAPPKSSRVACAPKYDQDYGNVLEVTALSGPDLGKTFTFYHDNRTEPSPGSCVLLNYYDDSSSTPGWASSRPTDCEEAVKPLLREAGREVNDEFIAEAKERMEFGSEEYIFMELFWPAFQEYRIRSRDPQLQPNFKGKLFDRVCKNTLSKEDNALAKKWKESFGYERCGPNEENFYRFLGWYHKDFKDYQATGNWFDFSYTEGLSDEILSDRAHISLFGLAYQFNMYVAAELSEESLRPILVPIFKNGFLSFVESIKRTAEYTFDVQSLDQVKKKSRDQDLFDEEIRLYAGLVEDPDEYSAIIDAFIDQANSGMTPDEKAFFKLYESFAWVEGCYKATESVLGNYVTYPQYQAATQKFREVEKQFSVPKSKQNEIKAEIDADFKDARQAIFVSVWDDYFNNTCEGMYHIFMGYL